MPKRIFSVILPLAALLFAGCEDMESAINSITIRGSGKPASEKREVRGFHAVSLSGVGELMLRQGGAESLSIEAEDNILPKIVTEVEDGRLKIGVERGVSIRPTLPVRYTLVVTDLTDLELSGSGKILAGPLQCGDLSVHVSGSGDMQLESLTADTLQGSISGSGDIRIAGQVARQKIQISGSGDYDGKDLESRSAEVSVSGSGDSTLWVRDSLNVRVSGSGDVAYYGSPAITRRVSGSGRLRNLGERR